DIKSTIGFVIDKQVDIESFFKLPGHVTVEVARRAWFTRHTAHTLYYLCRPPNRRLVPAHIGPNWAIAYRTGTLLQRKPRFGRMGKTLNIRLTAWGERRFPSEAPFSVSMACRHPINWFSTLKIQSQSP